MKKTPAKPVAARGVSLGKPQIKSATIASGAATSGAVDCGDRRLCGVFLPSTLDGTVLTFTACDTLAGTYLSVRNLAGAAVSITVAASMYVPLDPDIFDGLRFIKLTMGTNQSTTDTVIPLALR